MYVIASRVLQPLSRLDLRKTKLGLGIEVGASQSVEAYANLKVVASIVNPYQIRHNKDYKNYLLKCLL